MIFSPFFGLLLGYLLSDIFTIKPFLDMKNKNISCHYNVMARILVGKHQDGAPEYQMLERKFEDENPVLAREAAFAFFDSYTHGLLLGKGVSQRQTESITDSETKKTLQPFVDKTRYKDVELFGKILNLPDLKKNGVWIEFIIDSNPDEKLTIHAVDKIYNKIRPPEIYDLETEYEFYKLNNLDTKNHQTTIKYYCKDDHNEGFEDDALGEHNILATPFNWKGYDKVEWWEKKSSKSNL